MVAIAVKMVDERRENFYEISKLVEIVVVGRLYRRCEIVEGGICSPRNKVQHAKKGKAPSKTGLAHAATRQAS